MILIFSLTDDINRVLEQQWTDFNRSSYNTRNHLSRCRRILQGTWRGQLPPGWSVEGKWYVRLSNGGYIHLSVLKWKHCCDSRLSVVERWWVMKNSCSVGEIRFCNMWPQDGSVVYMGSCTTTCLWDQRKTFRSEFYHSVIWVLWTKLKSGLVASTSTSRATSLAHQQLSLMFLFLYMLCCIYSGDGTQDLTNAQYTLTTEHYLNF